MTTITETRADVVVPAEQCGRSLIGFATALLLKGGRSGTEERLLDPFRGHGLAVRKNVAVARCLRHLGVAENGAGRPQVELVFTGRYAREELIARAGVVTEMRKVKHHFDEGVEARRGIEF